MFPVSSSQFVPSFTACAAPLIFCYGEQILAAAKPLAASIWRWGVSLDTRFTRLITLPMAAANPNAVAVSSEMNSQLNPTSFYMDFIARLNPADKIDFLQDAQLQQNYLTLQKLLSDLMQFVANKAHGYTAFREELLRFCESYYTVEQNLKYMLDDLTQAELASSFSPLQCKSFQLSLPKCSVDKTSRQSGQMRVSVSEGKVFEDGRELPRQGEVTNDSTPCGMNPVEEALLERVIQQAGGILGALRMEGGARQLTFEQFKKIFDNKVIDNVRSAIDQIKTQVEENIGDVGSFITSLIVKKQSEVEKAIRRTIHNICIAQKKMLEKLSREEPSRKLTLKTNRVEHSLNLEWEVTEERPGRLGGYFTSSTMQTLFSFRLGAASHGSKRDL
jgi:hypothetical protein